jgi:hypothetical protein
MSKAAKSTKTKIIGISHQSFLFHIKYINSPIIPTRVKKPPYFCFLSLTIDNPPFAKRGIYSEKRIRISLTTHQIFHLSRPKGLPHKNFHNNKNIYFLPHCGNSVKGWRMIFQLAASSFQVIAIVSRELPSGHRIYTTSIGVWA